MDVRIDYSNCMAGVIGAEYGTTDASLAESSSIFADCLRSLEARAREQGSAYYENDRTNEIKAILDFAEEALPDVDDFIVAGPADATLGSRVLHAAFNYPPALQGKRVPQIHFWDGLDPDRLTALLFRVNDLRGALFHLIGNSAEPQQEVAISTAIHQLLHKERINPRQNLVVSAHPGSPLWKQAKDEGCRVFAVPAQGKSLRNILTPASWIWSAFAEFDIVQLLEGARKMAERCRSIEIAANPAVILAQLWSFPARYATLISGNLRLRVLSEWFGHVFPPQSGGGKSALSMFVRVERPRKDYKLEGSVIHENHVMSGKTLHQLLLEQQAAAIESLAAKGQPSLVLRMERLNERSLGALICLLERAADLHAEFQNVTAPAWGERRSTDKEKAAAAKAHSYTV